MSFFKRIASYNYIIKKKYHKCNRKMLIFTIVNEFVLKFNSRFDIIIMELYVKEDMP